jgi:hypothetical protein
MTAWSTSSTVLEIGRDARAALAGAGSVHVVMTFSRGEVLETDRGEIVWCDHDAEAFSPRGVLTAERGGSAESPAMAPATASHIAPGMPRERDLDDVLDRACVAFLADVDRGVAIEVASRPLVGLGRGLTPAGDDFLGGFLCALHHLGRPVAIDLAIDAASTHAISRARLAMHQRGEGTRAEVRFVNLLTMRRDTRPAEAILKRHGHSSGEDFMRGARAAMAREMV